MGADPSGLDFGGCEVPGVLCPSCASRGCPTSGSDIGNTVEKNDSGFFFTDSTGADPVTGQTGLLRDTAYAVLIGDGPGGTLCQAGETDVFLGNLDWSSNAATRNYVVPSLASLEHLGDGNILWRYGPIKSGNTFVRPYRIRCEDCFEPPLFLPPMPPPPPPGGGGGGQVAGSYAPDPFSPDDDEMASPAEMNKEPSPASKDAFSDPGGSPVQYFLLPGVDEDMSAVQSFELCFASPIFMNRITVGVAPPTGYTGVLSWDNCPLGSEWVNGKKFGPCESATGNYDPIHGIYQNVDPQYSYSHTHYETNFNYLILEGSIPKLTETLPVLSTVAHTSEHDVEMTCVAKLHATEPFDLVGDVNPDGVPDTPPQLHPPSPDEFEGMITTGNFSGICTKDPFLSSQAEDGFCDESEYSPNTETANVDPSDVDDDGRRSEEDNCPFEPNPPQGDFGGFQGFQSISEEPDGRGNLCQCGDADNSGVISAELSEDLQEMQNLLLTASDPTLQERCSVGGGSDCTILDAVILKRTIDLQQKPSEFNENCAAYTGS